MSCIIHCETLAYLYGVKTVALPERHQRLQVCENNWVRIVRVKRVARRRMDELKEEICVQVGLTGRLVKCWLKQTRHLVRVEEERMVKRADRLREQGRRKGGRPWL